MNLKNLSKEQQQKYVLLAIVAVAGLFAIKQFVLAPLLANHAKARNELRELEDKLALAEKTLKRDDEIAAALADSEKTMRTAARELLPSPENALAWATRTIYAQARALGIDIESVSDLEGDVTGFMAKEQEKRVFKPYGVRVVTQCSYAALQRLVTALEVQDPYVSITGITISGQLNAPERHQIMLNIQWPSWKSAEKSRAFLEEAKHASS